MEEIDYDEVKGRLADWKHYQQLPQRIMEKKYENHNRDWYRYLQSIEWDSYPPNYWNDMRKEQEEKERKRHPFNKWI